MFRKHFAFFLKQVFWALEIWKFSTRVIYCNGLLKFWLFFCKLYLLWIVPNGFIDKISYPKTKFYNKQCEPREFWNKSIYRLNHILNSLIFLSKYLIFVALKCFNSIHKLDQFRKVWNFQASYISSEVLKLTNSIHILDSFAKQFQLWRFSFFPSCFIDKIGSRFLSSKLLEHRKMKKKIKFSSYWIGSQNNQFF